MTLNEVADKVNGISATNTIRIKYFSNPKCLKAYTNHLVTKTTEMTGKIGVDYSMLESVQKRNADPNYVPKQRNTDTSWIIDKKLQHNNKTGSDLLLFYPDRNPDCVTTITHTDEHGLQETIDYDQMRTYCGSAGQPRKQLDENGNQVYSELMYINANNIYSIEVL